MPSLRLKLRFRAGCLTDTDKATAHHRKETHMTNNQPQDPHLGSHDPIVSPTKQPRPGWPMNIPVLIVIAAILIVGAIFGVIYALR